MDVCPNGGWGWIIVAAVAFINMTNQSLLSVFGLLFGSELKSMAQEETFTAALITNLNSMALNFSGLFIGPLIRNFKSRNVAATGCVLVSFGMMICAFASKPWHFIVGYSFFVGLGLGLISPSTFMAINSYFSTKRGRAVGISLAGAGLGQVVIPHIVRLYLDQHGFRAAVLAMSLLSLSGLFGALLLRPLPTMTAPKSHNNCQHIKPLLNVDGDKELTHTSTTLQAENTETAASTALVSNGKAAVYHETTTPTKATSTQKLCAKLWNRLAQAMDLELLRDSVFWNIILGMGLVYTSTTNFTMLFPSFLQYSVGMSRVHTANCMSVMAGADIVFRLLLPCVTDKLSVPYRVIFLTGTTGLLITRAALAESYDMTNIITMSILIGMSKSATVLNNNLTISSHCQAEKLAGGLGLNMIAKGVLVITVGQFLGWVRDYTNSYVLCLHAQNVILLLVVLVWSPEMYYRFRKQRKSDKLLVTAAQPNVV